MKLAGFVKDSARLGGAHDIEVYGTDQDRDQVGVIELEGSEKPAE